MSNITNIKNWSEAKLKEDDNDPDDLSAAKFNKWRQCTRAKKVEEDWKKTEVEVEVKRRAEAAAAAVKRRA